MTTENIEEGGVHQTVSLSLFRFPGIWERLWAFAQMGLARRCVRRLPGLTFYKLCGTGIGEGFTPLPNTAVYALLAVWESEERAREQVTNAEIFKAYRRRASHCWTLYLKTSSARGRWSGEAPFHPNPGDLPSDAPHGMDSKTNIGTNKRTDNGPEAPIAAPIAALTRASLKPSILWRFWGRVPAISDVIGADPNVSFKIGMGEIPWLHQVTFSIWPDLASMANFARRPGPHADAIRAVREGAWFQEELYARFRIIGSEGAWQEGSAIKSPKPLHMPNYPIANPSKP